MAERLIVKGAAMQQALNQIRQARNHFDMESTSCDQAADAVGHHGLEAALKKFGNDWKIKREKLSEKLAIVEGNMALSIKTFGDTDKELAKSLTVNESGSKGSGGKAPGGKTGGTGSGDHSGSSSGAGASGAGASGHKEGASGSAGPATGSGKPKAPLPKVPDIGETPGKEHAPEPGSNTPPALTDVINRLTLAVKGWESMSPEKRALLFTAIGTAGLTLLVRAGKLPKSVLDQVKPKGPARPKVPGKPGGPKVPPVAEVPPPSPQDPPTPPADGADPGTTPPEVPSIDEPPAAEVPPTGEPPTDKGPTDATPMPVDPVPGDGSPPPTLTPVEPAPVEGTPTGSTGVPQPPADLPAVPSIEEVLAPAGGGGSTSSGGGGVGGGGSAPAAPAAADLPPLPDLSESPAGSGGSGGSALPSIADAVGTTQPSISSSREIPALPPLKESLGERTPDHMGMGMGMSAGMGMASMANTLGGGANLANNAVSSKAVHDAKVADAVKAMDDLRDEAKEKKEK